jgi:hypothetical protein
VDAMSETDPAILGVQSCGCITFAHSRPDVLDREDQKAIGEIVASGGQIIRTTVGEARKMPHFLVGECPHDPKGWEPYRPVDSYEPKASYRRTTRGGRPASRVSVKTRWSRGWPAGEVMKLHGSWWATEGWFADVASNPPTASDGRDPRGPEHVEGPFPSQRKATDWLIPIAVRKSRALSERLSKNRVAA